MSCAHIRLHLLSLILFYIITLHSFYIYTEENKLQWKSFSASKDTSTCRGHAPSFVATTRSVIKLRSRNGRRTTTTMFSLNLLHHPLYWTTTVIRTKQLQPVLKDLFALPQSIDSSTDQAWILSHPPPIFPFPPPFNANVAFPLNQQSRSNLKRLLWTILDALYASHWHPFVQHKNPPPSTISESSQSDALLGRMYIKLNNTFHTIIFPFPNTLPFVHNWLANLFSLSDPTFYAPSALCLYISELDLFLTLYIQTTNTSTCTAV